MFSKPLKQIADSVAEVLVDGYTKKWYNINLIPKPILSEITNFLYSISGEIKWVIKNHELRELTQNNGNPNNNIKLYSNNTSLGKITFRISLECQRNNHHHYQIPPIMNILPHQMSLEWKGPQTDITSMKLYWIINFKEINKTDEDVGFCNQQHYGHPNNMHNSMHQNNGLKYNIDLNKLLDYDEITINVKFKIRHIQVDNGGMNHIQIPGRTSKYLWYKYINGYDVATTAYAMPVVYNSIPLNNPFDKLTKEIKKLRNTVEELCNRVNKYEKYTNILINNDDIMLILNEINLQEYYDLFINNGIENINDLITLNRDDIKTIGITKLGHRNRILKYINTYKISSINHLK